ncbi:MAG: CPBP family glutamic-type intramembrane protease [Candidatus Methanofastidiosia archaeon]
MKNEKVYEFFFFLAVSLTLLYVNRSLHSYTFRGFIYKEAVFYLIFPVGILLLLRKKLSSYGLSLGDKALVKRYFIILFLIAIPFMLVGSRMETFRFYYPRFVFGSWHEFIYWELLVGVLMLSTEFFFRGFMMFGLKRSGRWAILIQALPYTYVHIGKPINEVFYSFFAGLAFGHVDRESRSILPSFLLHWSTSIIFDILCMM